MRGMDVGSAEIYDDIMLTRDVNMPSQEIHVDFVVLLTKSTKIPFDFLADGVTGQCHEPFFGQKRPLENIHTTCMIRH